MPTDTSSCGVNHITYVMGSIYTLRKPFPLADLRDPWVFSVKVRYSCRLLDRSPKVEPLGIKCLYISQITKCLYVWEMVVGCGGHNLGIRLFICVVESFVRV